MADQRSESRLKTDESLPVVSPMEENTPISASSPNSSSTALHQACLKNDLDLVVQLCSDPTVDINAVDQDGAQPIHIAGLLNYTDIVYTLISSGASVALEFSREVFSKYTLNSEWSEIFGDKMSLLTFAVINQRDTLACQLILMKTDVDLTVRDNRNRTLLMYTIEKQDWMMASLFAAVLKRHCWLANVLDNNGLHVLHYLLHPNDYEGFRYDQRDILEVDSTPRCFILDALIRAGANIHATINGDPDTIALNIAAFRGRSDLVEILLPAYTDMNQCHALKNATIPAENSDKYLRVHENVVDMNDPTSQMRLKIQDTIEMILRNMLLRSACGLPVPEEERIVMDSLLASDSAMNKFVIDFEAFITSLKQEVFTYGDKSLTLLDLARKAYDRRQLMLMVLDDTFIQSFAKYLRETKICHVNVRCFKSMFAPKIGQAYKRMKLAKESKKIPNLKKSIPLPYEVILEVMEYFNNDELEKFISVFYEKFECEIEDLSCCNLTSFDAEVKELAVKIRRIVKKKLEIVTSIYHSSGNARSKAYNVTYYTRIPDLMSGSYEFKTVKTLI